MGCALFRQLNLQLLIVTPLQKIHIIEPFVASAGLRTQRRRAGFKVALSVDRGISDAQGRSGS